MTQTVVTIVCALFLVLSLAALTHCQDPSDQNIDLLRQILKGDVDIITIPEEDEEVSDDLSVPYFENEAPSFRKRGICPYRGCMRIRRYRIRQRRPQKPQPPQKRLFCNFGGCFNGKRNDQKVPKLTLQRLLRGK